MRRLTDLPVARLALAAAASAVAPAAWAHPGHGHEQHDAWGPLHVFTSAEHLPLAVLIGAALAATVVAGVVVARRARRARAARSVARDASSRSA